ncbi:MAG: phytanoyl-CoA dioxygenase family protein [Lentisphaeria bacterium]|jgi:ectoine hydroxylase-related dioxygenase (phytanoyl-CoA dioxygenase family)|nr:phytanoyl-CoA dioxygenase family protein [Lentisphaeria bacterium]
MSQPIRLSGEDIERYHRDGYLVVADLLTEPEVAAFVKHERASEPMAQRLGILTHRIDPRWAAVAAHPNTAGIAQQLLGGTPRIVQTMYMPKGPAPAGGELGEVGVALHQDTHYLPSEPNTLMACWIAMSDTDPENGGFCVVPGSHTDELLATHPSTSAEHVSWEIDHPMRDRDGREWTQRVYAFQVDGIGREDTTELTVPRGSGVFFSGLVIHGSYANRSSDRHRLALAVHYVKDGSWVIRCDVQETTLVTEFSRQLKENQHSMNGSPPPTGV